MGRIRCGEQKKGWRGSRLTVQIYRNRADLSITPVRLHRPSSPLVHSNNIHINADSLVRNNLKRLGFCTNMLGCPSLHVEDVISRRPRNAVISVRVGGEPGDFFCPLPSADVRHKFPVSSSSPAAFHRQAQPPWVKRFSHALPRNRAVQHLLMQRPPQLGRGRRKSGT